MSNTKIKVGTTVRLVAHPKFAFQHHSQEDFTSWGYHLGMQGTVLEVDHKDANLPLSVDWVGLNRPHYFPSQLWVDYTSVEINHAN